MNATNTSSFNVYYSKIVSFPKVGVKRLTIIDDNRFSQLNNVIWCQCSAIDIISIGKIISLMLGVKDSYVDINIDGLLLLFVPNRLIQKIFSIQ